MDRENQFIGQSGAFLDAVERARRAAPMRRPVLVIGARGTGKAHIPISMDEFKKVYGITVVSNMPRK